MAGETRDAYVFVPSGTEDTLGKLKKLWGADGVRYATRVLSGAFGSVAFLEAPLYNGDDVATLGDLRTKLTAVRNEVNPGTSVGIAYQTGIKAPTRWSDKKPIGAYVRIRTQAGVAGEVFAALNTMFDGNDQYGSALVIGDFDVLVEVDADTLDELGTMILAINGTAGVVSTDSAIVLNDRTEQLVPGDQ
jgi:hypothetical protein